MMSMSQIAEMVQPEPISTFDLFRVSAIEVAEEIQIVLSPRLMEDVATGDDLFKDTFGSIMFTSKLYRLSDKRGSCGNLWSTHGKTHVGP